MKFSAHTDAKGVLDLIQHVQPKATVLVHGEADKMQFLQQRIHSSLSIPCYAPKTGESVHINAPLRLPVVLSEASMERAMMARGAQLGSEHVKVCFQWLRQMVPKHPPMDFHVLHLLHHSMRCVQS